MQKFKKLPLGMPAGMPPDTGCTPNEMKIAEKRRSD